MTEKLQRLTSSPRKPTHLQVSRKLSRGGDDSFDNDDYETEYYNFHERRGSSQSISRFNSCPQLAEIDETAQHSYEKTVDDIDTNTGALNREMKCVVVQSPSPLFQKKLYLENGQISDTPTPPSTPKSRRSIISSRDSLLSSPDKPYVTSPFASPRLLLRKQVLQSSLNRDSSFDSLTDKPQAPLSTENVTKFDQISTEPPKSRHSDKSESHHLHLGKVSHHSDTADTVNKCENWLQTLNIVQSDRIKSRSHIQLPPI